MTKMLIDRSTVEQALEYMKAVGQMDMHPEEWAIVGRLEAALAEPVQELGPWTLEQCDRVIRTLRYIEGIAARGGGRPMREDETLEQFILGYVQKLEAGQPTALAEPVQEPVASACLGPLPAPAQPAEPEGYMPGCLWPLPATPDYYTAEQMREYALGALAKPQEPDSPERRCGGPGCDGTCCQPVQEPKPVAWPHINGTADTKWQPQRAGEPVAWMTVRLNVPIQTTARKDVADEWLKWGEVLPLYATPPQRKPLSGAAIYGLFVRSGLGAYHQKDFVVQTEYDRCIERFARAVERAHGIGGEE